MGADVVAHDPYIDRFEVDGTSITLSRDLGADLASCSVAVLLQAHGSYLADGALDAAPVIFDTRGVLSGDRVERL